MIDETDLELLEKFVMDSIDHGFVQGYFKTESGTEAVKKTIQYRFDLLKPDVSTRPLESKVKNDE